MAETPGAFEILEIPASGAYGTVCVARRAGAKGEDPVAIKVIKAEYVNAPGILQRARDEARLLYRLSHPNIVRVDELLEIGRRPVVVMEWVEGVSLKVLSERVRVLPPRVIVEVARQSAWALDAAFNHPDVESGEPMRVIHRDIKPSNVLLSLDGVVKVVDFGVARGEFSDREHSTISTIMGSHGYIAPERLEGKDDTAAVDIYSLGVTVFELFFGHPIFLPRNPDHHDRVLAEQANELNTGDLPDAARRQLLQLLVDMCLYLPELRPTAAECAEGLAEVLTRGEQAVDLYAFAESHARPIFEQRPKIPPKEHPDYAEIAFLEEGWKPETAVRTSDSLGAVPTTVVQKESTGDRRVRRFLAQSGWETQIKGLLWLLATNADWTEEPFLQVLSDYGVPWWKFWERRTSAAEAAAALQMLRHRRTEQVLERATELSTTPHAEVAQAARELLSVEERNPSRHQHKGR